VKSLSSVASNNKIVASGWMEGCVVVSVVGKTLGDRMNSKLCDSETQDKTQMSAVGERKRSIRLINNVKLFCFRLSINWQVVLKCR
jgi:hypothetical protein